MDEVKEDVMNLTAIGKYDFWRMFWQVGGVLEYLMQEAYFEKE